MIMWPFSKKEPTEEEKKISDAAFLKVQAGLLDMKNRLDRLEGAVGTQAQGVVKLAVGKLKEKLESIRADFVHLDKQQRKALAGLFKENESRINALQKKVSA